MCRPVLLALSAGDRRRQRELDVGEHLLSCPTCAALSPDLVERKRRLVALGPLLPLVVLGRWVRTRFRQRPALTTAVGATAAGAALSVFLVARSDDPSACGGALTVDGSPLDFSDIDRLAESAGGAVEGDNLPIESVPANEGFWLGCADGRVWIQLMGVGESRERFMPDQRLDFNGTVVSHPDDFSTSVGVDESQGARELDGQRIHVEVRYSDVRRR